MEEGKYIPFLFKVGYPKGEVVILVGKPPWLQNNCFTFSILFGYLGPDSICRSNSMSVHPCPFVVTPFMLPIWPLRLEPSLPSSAMVSVVVAEDCFLV